MSNYRELFERLAKSQLPAGMTLEIVYLTDIELRVNGKLTSGANLDHAPSCRSLLTLIVDAMRAEGWMFRFDDTMKGFRVEATLWDKARVLNGFIVEESEVARSEVGQDTDQVTALAECLIAALGPKEDA